MHRLPWTDGQLQELFVWQVKHLHTLEPLTYLLPPSEQRLLSLPWRTEFPSLVMKPLSQSLAPLHRETMFHRPAPLLSRQWAGMAPQESNGQC